MAFSTHPNGSGPRPDTARSGTFFKSLSKGLAKLAATAKSVLRAMQTARMMSVLSNMTDNQLSQIGISRSEIPWYAEKLVSEEQNDGLERYSVKP